MKIGQPIEATTVAGTAGGTSPAGARETGRSDAAQPPLAPPEGRPESATVHLSGTARELMSGTPEFNAEKVEAMRQAIAEGRFKPNPGAIADQLIANARELLTGPTH
ncbi:flagellar biosynthesis anti-sigma factor FlgM [Ramlibacter sp. 2FC]|uniref:flagellar biosynthesis anti-sigma factor FlgM n=1 Tax=Ramlibacter sp. 2FC TaxID=2502188 RepID=UPI0010F7B616|nr:flagellar biosynthesis anti-sigma factor FlgM [Ramlibacter sp. 2FC]